MALQITVLILRHCVNHYNMVVLTFVIKHILSGVSLFDRVYRHTVIVKCLLNVSLRPSTLKRDTQTQAFYVLY